MEEELEEIAEVAVEELQCNWKQQQLLEIGGGQEEAAVEKKTFREKVT
jgi:hypothetical protein